MGVRRKLGALVGAAAAIAGAVLYAGAALAFARAGDVRDRAPIAPARVEPGAGPVAVVGRARALGRDRTATSPLGRPACVHFEYSQQRSAGGRSETVERRRLSFPFLVVDDEGGAVLVDPNEASHLYGRAERRPGPPSQLEQTIAEGDEVLIHGRAAGPPVGSPARAAMTREGSVLVVSAAGAGAAVGSLAAACLATAVVAALALSLAARFLVPLFRPPRV